MNQHDPAAFAAEVRDLASRAHRELTSHDASPTELRLLSRRISRIRDEMDFMISDELSEWLDNLGDRVESREAGKMNYAPKHRAVRRTPARS
ncbi:hypothetical protein [Singulisphaera sp. PoT]|uniref:hypothetical protein n=1 Tax=Singulisphaera sp. PoT TaxID=3411797 RepID=UPI003BF51DBB